MEDEQEIQEGTQVGEEIYMAEYEMDVPEGQRIEQKEEYAVAKEPTEQR